MYPEVVVPHDSVNGLVGDDLILHCYLKNNLSAVDMDVQWIIQQNDLVHHYKGRIDTTDDQLPAYRNRTSLFKDELQKGNISLKLRSVRLSDTNTYRCYVSGGSGSDEASINLNVIGKCISERNYIFVWFSFTLGWINSAVWILIC